MTREQTLTDLEMARFAEQLRTLRVQRKLSQVRLAELLGVSPRVYNRWEKGAATPHLDTVVQLAELLQVSLDELTGRQKATSEPKIRNHALGSLYREVDKLPDEDQKALLILLDSLVKRNRVEKALAT